MVNFKHMLVLANSIKHNARCIAGREVTMAGQAYQIGQWIRPITTHDEGAVDLSECKLEQGGCPEVMQFVQVPLIHNAQDRSQPENWLIVPGEKWKSVEGLYSKPPIAQLVEWPEDLWLENGNYSDRITVRAMAHRIATPSIYIIRVEELVFGFGWKHYNPRQRERRAYFKYNDVDYALSITDPDFDAKYRHLQTPRGETEKRYYANQKNPCHICVSLAPPFRGDHYKVVATIFEDQ